MNDGTRLTDQAFQTYKRVERRLEEAMARKKKFTIRGQRTMAFAALKLRIDRLNRVKNKLHARYLRRKAD
jgi:hypothetical protein